MGSLIFLAVLFVAMWVFVVLPQQRRQRAHQTVVAATQVGDEIITTSGIYGTITAIEGDVLSLEVAPGVEIRIARQAILRRLTEDDEVADLDESVSSSDDEPKLFDEAPDTAD